MAKAQPDENQDFGSERIVVETRCNFLALARNCAEVETYGAKGARWQKSQWEFTVQAKQPQKSLRFLSFCFRLNC